ncbi:copper-binding protein [Lutibaculum baratangense]|nr:copper-binding protein [Lutibaculum baratangense]
MKRTLAAAALTILAATSAYAQATLAEGEVTKIDAKQGKMTVRHGPIPSLDMTDGMTMVFRVKEDAMLEQVKSGDKIAFDVERINGALTITVLEKQ